MQKETEPYPRSYASVDLPLDFPVVGGPIQVKRDGPISQLHHHNCLEIGFCHRGNGLYLIGNQLLPFSEGTVTVIAPDRPHFSSNAPGSESQWSWLMIDPVQLLAGFAPDAARYSDCTPFASDAFQSVYAGDEFAAFSAIVQSMVGELLSQKDGYQCAFRSQMLNLLVQLHRITPPQDGVDLGSRARIYPALDFLSRHYAEPIGPDDLARECHVCTVHFRRLFRVAMGVLPHQYIVRYRIRMAECLLTAGSDAIIDVAEKVGFRSLSSFNRQFRRLNGVSPTIWRRQKWVHASWKS